MTLINSLKKNNIKHLVYEAELETSVFVYEAKEAGIECIPVLDARSAVYYATGICAQNREMIAVVISSGNSRSAFSGMTEALYRKLPVILITLGNVLDYSKELGDVVENHYIVSQDSDLSDILANDYPMHIEIPNFVNIAKRIECEDLLVLLNEVLDIDKYLYISQGIESQKHNFSCKVVRGAVQNCADGVLSNVLGASLAKIRNRYIGLVSEKEFLRDMNTLGNINMNDLVLYIVVSQKKNEAIYNYAEALGFKVYSTGKGSVEGKQLKQAINNGKKTVVMVYEEA